MGYRNSIKSLKRGETKLPESLILNMQSMQYKQSKPSRFGLQIMVCIVTNFYKNTEKNQNFTFTFVLR